MVPMPSVRGAAQVMPLAVAWSPRGIITGRLIALSFRCPPK
jgi:hypothetical protein